MKFLYRHQVKGDVVEGEVSAPSIDSAYSVLRKSGVRPMKVWAKPGLFNRLAALGKRGYAIVTLAVLLAATLALFLGSRRTVPAEPVEGAGQEAVVRPTPGLRPLSRRQLSAFDAAFDFEAEAVLARFARPGDLSRLNADVDELARHFAADLDESFRHDIEIGGSDVNEVIALKRIVAGMKEEARLARMSGETADEILARLYERQKMEAAFRANAIAVLRSLVGSPDYQRRLAETNESLRLMGIEEVGDFSW